MPSNTLWFLTHLRTVIPRILHGLQGQGFCFYPQNEERTVLAHGLPPVNICWVKWMIRYYKEIYKRKILVYFLTLIAFWISMHESLMVCNNLLNRPISWTSTVFMLWVYVVGYLLIAASTSKLWGSLPKMSPATSSMTSSEDFAPASAERDCKECKQKTRIPHEVVGIAE